MAARRIAEDVDVAVRALRACLRSLSASGAIDEVAISEARREIERSDPADGPLGDLRGGEAHPAEASLSPDERGRTAETLRVPVARLDEVLFAAEDLSVLAGRRGGGEARFDRVDDTLSHSPAISAKPASCSASAPTCSPAGRTTRRAASSNERSPRRRRSPVGRQDQRLPPGAGMGRAVAATAARLRAESRGLRVVSFASLSPGIEQIALSASKSLDRPVQLVMSGEGVEIDRRVRDGLREPLMHLVRNAIDHGIEPRGEREARGKGAVGRVEVHAEVTGHDARIVVSDDGRGVVHRRAPSRRRGGGPPPGGGSPRACCRSSLRRGSPRAASPLGSRAAGRASTSCGRRSGRCTGR